MGDKLPWERVGEARARKRPGLVVDLRRCVGCHACSVACKTENEVPLGEFRMRVRYLMRPDRPQLAFLPLFSDKDCDFGQRRTSAGLDPACVAACPTGTLVFGDLDAKNDKAAKLAKDKGAKPFGGPAKTKEDVLYIGHEPWMETRVKAGVPLSKDDEDIVYEQ